MGWSVSLRIGGVLVELVYEADAQMSQSLRRHPPEYPGGSEESPHDPPTPLFRVEPENRERAQKKVSYIMGKI